MHGAFPLQCGRLAMLVPLALSLAGCAGVARKDPKPLALPERSCVRTHHAISLQTSGAAKRDEVPLPASLPASFPFSRTSLDTARVIGALPELMLIASAKDAASSPEQLLMAGQALMSRITLGMLEIASVTGEIDCENERSAQLRDRLQRTEEDRLRSLTVTGLVLGAATAILSGGIALASPDAASANVVNVVGGTAQAGTGYAALAYETRGRLLHERNVLADLWEGRSESTMFPAAIWRFLNQVREGGGEGPPLRQALLEQWKAGDRLGPPGSEEEARRVQLIFGKGGDYTVEDLRVRDAILDQLEAMVKLLYQDLGLLLREIAEQGLTRKQ